MYICMCNALTDKEVGSSLKALYAGEKSEVEVGDVFTYNNCTPKCGKCVDTIKGIIEEGGL